MDDVLRELLEMAAADQAFRSDSERFGRGAESDWAAEQARSMRMVEIIWEHVGPLVAGREDGASAAWLLVQHADGAVADRGSGGLDARRSRAGLEPFADNLARMQSVIDEHKL